MTDKPDQNDRQLLEQVLEALETKSFDLHSEWGGPFNGEDKLRELRNKAITAIRARLEQPEQEPVGTVKDLFTQAAWERLDVRGSTKVHLDTPPAAQPAPVQELVCVCGAVWQGQELVETPEAQRPVPEERKWVGLTLTEINAFEKGSVNRQALICAIEAKLKEKNSD